MGNPHLTAKIYFFVAPLPTSTKIRAAQVEQVPLEVSIGVYRAVREAFRGFLGTCGGRKRQGQVPKLFGL